LKFFSASFALAELDCDVLDVEVVELPDADEPDFHLPALTLLRR
jgi:hypothetical protein